jgi:PAS domain S-box-containing protein
VEKPQEPLPTLREYAEISLSERGRAKADALTPATPEEAQHLVHELQVHQIELEMQNDQLRNMESVVNASRAHYFDLYDKAPVAICTLDKTGCILEANTKAVLMLGVATRSMLLKNPLSRFIKKEDQDIYYLFQMQVRGAGGAQSCELRITPVGIEPFWARLEACVHEEQPGHGEVFVTISDISNLKIAEIEKSIAATTFETKIGQLVTDADWKILKVNRAFTQITGFAEQDLVGKTLDFLQSGRYEAAFFDEVREAVKTSNSWSGEVWNRRKNDDIHLEQVDIFTVKNAAGQTTHYVGSFRDITETYSLRSINVEWQYRFHALFDGALNCIVLADDQGKYVDVNAAACKLLGYSRDELLSMSISDVVAIGMGEHIIESRWQNFIDDRRQVGRMLLRHKDGQIIVADYSAVANIQPGVHLGVMSDVTAYVEAEVALTEAQQRLRTFSLRQQEEFDQLRSDVARDLHDQLGQTLSAIKLEVDVLSMHEPDACTYLYQLIKEGVSTVREVSRTLRPPSLDLGLVSAITAMVKSVSMRSDVDVSVVLPPNLPSLGMQTELSLYRIAQEALTNACNHAGASEIGLSLVIENDLLCLKIWDDGCGFSVSEHTTNSGLGLMGMSERAKLLGANFSINSAAESGTEIQLSLRNAMVGNSQ